jgi:hypothetical protein
MPRPPKTMNIETLYVFVEEPSMAIALEHLLPKMLRQGIEAKIIQFQCKDDLLKNLLARLKAYTKWLGSTAMLLVIVDRDDDDCLELKQKLETIAHQAGLQTRQSTQKSLFPAHPPSDIPAPNEFQVINRIAIEELEAWFFGDWHAVCNAYPKMDVHTPQKAPYRNPDQIKGGTWEALEREFQKKGYFKQGLPKREVARRVAQMMNPSDNTSSSFCCLHRSLQQL